MDGRVNKRWREYREGHFLVSLFQLTSSSHKKEFRGNPNIFHKVKVYRRTDVYLLQRGSSGGDGLSLLCFTPLFQRERSLDDKWGFPYLTGKSRVISLTFQWAEWERGETDKSKFPVCHAWNIYEGCTTEKLVEVNISPDMLKIRRYLFQKKKI